MTHPTEKRYLGDGVEASFDGYNVVLTTGTATIYFDDRVAQAAIDYFNQAFGWETKDDNEETT